MALTIRLIHQTTIKTLFMISQNTFIDQVFEINEFISNNIIFFIRWGMNNTNQALPKSGYYSTT